MKWIAHRGNRHGPNPERENTVDYIMEALDAGFDCEIDVWYAVGQWWLGHDGPTHAINCKLLAHPRLWCHAKNIEALRRMLSDDLKPHCFAHQSDDVILTSKGYIWTFPGKSLTDRSICVKPDVSNQDYTQCAGVCSDFIEELRNTWQR